MSKVEELRRRAERCRMIARDYHPSVGAPLLDSAAEFEREASRLERADVERRMERACG